MKEFLKVSVSGVRGVVGESFTPQVAAAFARAFGTFVGRGAVLVGRDTRPTGRMLEHAVVSGLQSVGCKPLLAGVVPTPTLLVLTRTTSARGAVAITASHNPSRWNAMKFVDRDGLFLGPARADELLDVYHQGDFDMVPEQDILQSTIWPNPTAIHFDKVLDYVDRAAIRAAGFKVAVDCCNGVGALYTRGFLERLGCEVVACHDAPTGAFERDPEPLPENLGALCALTAQHGCDVGFAQDPDGDRLAVVDECGTPLGEDMTVTFAVRQVLEHHAGGPIVVHLSTSRSVQDVATRYGADLTRTKIGEINVSQAMLERGAVAGGEGNGGVIIPAIHPCRDSFAGMAVILELMATTGKAVSVLRDEFPRYHLLKDKVRIRSDRAPAVLRALRRRYEGENMNLLDGVHVEQGNKWFHVRLSNTEPVIRLTVEAPDREEAERLAAEVKAQITAPDPE